MTYGSVGWYKAWERVQWSSPDPVALFDLFIWRNGESHRDTGRAKGLFRLVNRVAHSLPPVNDRRIAAQQCLAL